MWLYRLRDFDSENIREGWVDARMGGEVDSGAFVRDVDRICKKKHLIDRCGILDGAIVNPPDYSNIDVMYEVAHLLLV